MSSRDTILANVCAALGDRAVDAIRIRAEADALLHDVLATRPSLSTTTIVESFSARVISPKVGATVERVANMAGLPASVERYLDKHGLPRTVALQPSAALGRLDWRGLSVHNTPAPDEAVGVALAEWGIAETGSVVFHSGSDTAILANFLPLHHLVAVFAETIVPYLEDYAREAAATGLHPPRNVNITTGASGTTDIEGSLVRGAHGPRFLHILIVG